MTPAFFSLDQILSRMDQPDYSINHNHSMLSPAPAPVWEPRAAVYWCCLGAGPLLQLLASLLLPALLPPAVTSCQLRRGKWAATFIARINAAITGIWVSRAADILPSELHAAVPSVHCRL